MAEETSTAFEGIDSLVLERVARGLMDKGCTMPMIDNPEVQLYSQGAVAKLAFEYGKVRAVNILMDEIEDRKARAMERV